MRARIRQAERTDIPGIWDVRYAVQENTLRRGVIDDEDVRREIEDTGRGWVVAEQGSEGGPERILAFAIANAQSGNIWALFVMPQAQGRGHGLNLYAEMLHWLRAQGLRKLWLTTGPDTRALGFYERRGWQRTGAIEHGDLRLELLL